jgi:type IV secretory pathway VirB9-like protein
MDTTVVLPEGEEIAAYSLADGKTFEFHPYTPASGKDSRPELRNIFRILGKYPGADTNLTVIGKSRRIYSFYLRVDSVQSKFLPVLVAYIKAPPMILMSDAGDSVSHAKPDAAGASAKPGEKPVNTPPKDGIEAAAEAEYLRELGVPNARDIAPNYAMSGDKQLAPVKVFDDGQWTYFKFSDDNLDKVRRLPAIYRVVDGVDSPVNTRVIKGTLIAETTSGGWTLRNGDAHLCIRKQ